jgi:superfamily II DNA/RNA helicase
MEFEQLGLCYDVLDGIESMGFKEATPIQQQAIPAALDGKDLIACAQTGTGKTAAFLLPIIDRIITSEPKDSNSIRALVIVPTRELALQIDQQLTAMAYYTPVTSCAVYGGSDGSSFDQQKKALTTGTEIIIATPGKLLSHLNLGYVKADGLECLIMDEADRMLDMGFYEDIMRIIDFLPKTRQTLLFSATMPPEIRTMASTVLNDPLEITIALSKPAEGVDQQAYLVYDANKYELIENLLRDNEATSIIIFAGTKKMAGDIARKLAKKKFDARVISSNLDQTEREEVLLSFRNRRLRILVATNVVSRGIDIEDIDIVVNFDVPKDPEDYVHRVGRTARAKRKGQAITLVNEHDMRSFGRIEELIGYPVKKMPMPAGLPPGPDYDPNKRSSGGRPSGNRGNFKGGSKRRPPQGKRNFKGKKKGGSSKNRPSGNRSKS